MTNVLNRYRSKRQYWRPGAGSSFCQSISDLLFSCCSPNFIAKAFVASTAEHWFGPPEMEKLCISSFLCLRLFWPLGAFCLFFLVSRFKNFTKSGIKYWRVVTTSKEKTSMLKAMNYWLPKVCCCTSKPTSA